MKTNHCFYGIRFPVPAPVVPGTATGRNLLMCLLLMSVFGLSSCFLHYYRTNTEQKKDAAKLQDLMDGGKYFILHAGTRPKALMGVKMNNGKVEGDITHLEPEHTKYLRPVNFEKNRFRVKDKDFVLYEVHLYTHDTTAKQGKVSLPLNAFYRIDVYELNEQATKHSRIASTIGIVLSTAGVVALIIAANDLNDWGESDNNPQPSSTGNSSYTCSPQVYAVNDSGRRLTGILYSGAIFAPLERTDYMPLHGVKDAVHLQLRGGQNEELFVGETKLLQVTHPSGHNVMPDKKGKIHTYGSPSTSRRAMVAKDKDVNAAVTAKDDYYYSFTNDPNEQGASDVILDFKKPAGAVKGKLIVRAKNSTWANYLFRKFKSLYGESYARVLEKKDKADPKKLLQCAIDQSLPLSVSVKHGDKWKAVDFFYTPGNEVLRDMIMEIDLSEFAASEQVQIKLETTYMFWDLDYVAMDFSENISFVQQFASAKKITRVNTLTGIQEATPKGNIHLSEQEYLDLSFAVQPATGYGQTNSYFLVGTGYYHDNTRYEGKIQLASLARFSRKGAFDKFSRENFNELAEMFKTTDPTRLTAKQ